MQYTAHTLTIGRILHTGVIHDNTIITSTIGGVAEAGVAIAQLRGFSSQFVLSLLQQGKPCVDIYKFSRRCAKNKIE